MSDPFESLARADEEAVLSQEEASWKVRSPSPYTVNPHADATTLIRDPCPGCGSPDCWEVFCNVGTEDI